MEYDVDTTRYLVQIKSGINWGNSSQRKALVRSFNAAKRTLQANKRISVECIEGICYGRSKTKHWGTHIQMVGRDFWREISDWHGTAEGVMDLLGKHAGNGLGAIRADACNTMVDFLRERGIEDGSGLVYWNRLLDLVMDDSK